MHETAKRMGYSRFVELIEEAHGLDERETRVEHLLADGSNKRKYMMKIM